MKILNSIMAFMILLASTGLSINMHFCHDFLIDVAVINQADSCCDMSQTSKCCGIDEMTKKSHCENKHLAVETDTDYLLSNFIFNFEDNHTVELPWLATSYFNYITTLQDHHPVIPDFSRPPPYPDVVLSEIQVFLI